MPFFNAFFNAFFNKTSCFEKMTNNIKMGSVYSLFQQEIGYINLQPYTKYGCKTCFQATKVQSCHPLLIHLHWLPVKQRIHFKVLNFTFKGLHNMAPADISDMFVVKPNRYSYRSSAAQPVN